MRGQDSAVAMNERQFRRLDLTTLGLAAQLTHSLDHMEHAAGSTGMCIRQQSAMRVARQTPIEIERAGLNRRTGLAPREKADGFQFRQQGDREAVVDLGDVDIGGRNARAGERLPRRLLAAEVRQRRRCDDMLMGVHLARAENITTIIDNSYCTPLFQRPIGMGIDIVMQTATKYIGGHSDTLGGVLTGSGAIMKKIFDSEYLNIGSGVQPFNAWLLLRGLRTMPARLERLTHTTRQVVDYLKQHPRVESVLFPFDETFPQYELARQQMDGACGLSSFYVRATEMGQIVRLCESLRHIMMAVSWGGHESLILPRCASIEPGDFDPSNKEHRMLRLYTGLEDASYLIADLEQAFLKAWP